MKIVFFSILLLYSCFCNSQTNRNEDFVLKGIQAAKEQKYSLAISYLQFSLKDKNLPDSIKISGEFYLQYAYYNTNNSKFSIEKLDTIVPKYTNYNDSIATLFIKNTAYNLSQDGYYDKALEYGKQATERIKWLYGSQSLVYANNLDNLALRYIDCNMLDSAMSNVQKAGMIIKQLKGKKDVDYAHNLNNLATIYNEKGQYEKAIKYRKKAMNIVKNTDDVIFHAILLDNLGRDYWHNSNIQLALEHNEQALNVLNKNKNYTNDYIITLLNLADKYSGLNNYEKANNYYKKGLLETKKLKGINNLTYANTMIKLAMNYWSMGEYNDFCNYSDSALLLMDNIYDNNDYQYLYYQREIIEKYMLQEDFLKAKEKIENILEDDIELSTKDSVYYYSNLSTCYAKIPLDYLTAFQLQNIAVDIANRYYDKQSKEGLSDFLKLKCNETKYLMELFELHRDEPDEYKKRMESIRETIYLIVGLGENRLDRASPSLIDSYILLINFHINLNELEKAYELCISVLSKTNLDTYSSVSLMNRLVVISLLKEDYDFALKISKEMINLLESEKDIKLDTYCSSLAYLATCYIGNKQHDMAIETLNKRLSILNDNISIANYLDRNNEGTYTWWLMYSYLPTILYYSNYNGYSNLTYNTVLNFKNIQSEATNIIIENSIYNESDVIYNKYVELNKLNRKLNILIERGETNKKELNSITKTIRELEKDLLKESASYSNIQRLINLTWKDIQKGLCPNDISIEFVDVEDDKYLALLLKSDWNDVKAIHLTVPKDITSETEAIKIWEPIKDYISPGDNIYFSASGILHQIPIESLPIGDGKIMSDVYNMHRLSSTRELVKEKKKVKYTKAALYGGLNYDMTDSELLAENQTYSKNASKEYFVSRGLLEDSIRGYKWDNLSNTQQEVDYISDLMKKNQITTQTYKGNKGNEESFKALSGHEYNIIHLATHGFFYPEEEAKEKDYFKPMLLNEHSRMYNEVDMSMWRSGLVMSGGNRAWKGDTIPDKVEDGILKAQEIGDLDLRGAGLVVLSACNTGQGEVTGEGVFGLQRAFKMAGAQTIVMSLTPVDDQTTMAMMNKFYTNLFSGQSKHDAFYNAQRYIRSIKPDPKYWMGWIMLD